MANSSIVSDMKDKVINEILNDKNIVQALDIKNLEYVDDLINQNIFRYNRNPNTVQEDITFITVQVHIPENRDRSKKWVKPILEIWIISKDSHMTVTNIPRITANRNDYISQLIDEKFNGRDDFGFGQLFLERNVEGVCPSANNFLFRQMVFVTQDLNKSICR